MAVGAALVAIPGALGHGFSDVATFRPLFLVPCAASLAAIVCVFLAEDPPGAAAEGSADPASNLALLRHENRQLRRLAFTNVVNGFAIGIIGPLIAYWFARRFGRGPEAIGPALAAGFLLGAAGSAVNAWWSVRVGAAACYAGRSALNQGTVGARQAVAAELTRAERRGLAASVQSLSLQIPRAAGPVLGGWLVGTGRLVAPFILAATLQGLYLLLYRRYFSVLDEAAETAA